MNTLAFLGVYIVDFDLFLKFNRKNVQDRQVDTLIGISKGLVADGKLNQQEVEFLQTWLTQSQSQNENPIIINLLDKVNQILEDGVVDKEESDELFKILKSFSGENAVVGEVAKTTNLPLNIPEPKIIFRNNNFLFTGTCAFGTRKICQEEIERLGGVNANSVTKQLNYLILGTYVTDSWVHETFGRKIEKAVEYRDSGVPLVIVTEAHWLKEAGLS